MAQASKSISHLAGVDLDARTTDAVFELGTTVLGDENSVYVYVQANGSVATGTCTVTTSTWQLTDAAGNFTADVAFADNEYGFVRQTADFAA